MAGNKNSGRRTTEEELAYLKKSIKQNLLEELAKEKVYNHVKMTKSSDRQGIKEIVLPVYLKSQANKVEGGLKLEQVTGFKIEDDNNNKTNNKTEDSLEDTTE